MRNLIELCAKSKRNIIGLMSGTSLDGIDAALVTVEGNFTDTKVKTLAFRNYPFPEGVRERIFRLFDSDIKASDLCHMNFLLGEIFANAALSIAKEYGMSMDEVDAISSHGQTIYHIPSPVSDLGMDIRSTLQMGEGAVIARRTGVITVSDFRVMDMAAGGQGAPLVPYVDYVLYSSKEENVALQNIGGIGNVTILPKACQPDAVTAFDTGPGNMAVDELMRIITGGKKEYDENGNLAASGEVNTELLKELLSAPYFSKPLPKTTGREDFGKEFTRQLYDRCVGLGMSEADMVATATMFTAATIGIAIRDFSPCEIQKLIVGGGGAYNKTLLSMLRGELPKVKVCTQEELGFSSDAKEAVAFAVLANETLSGRTNNLCSATGASSPQVLGKINLV